jgi:hypothetical protein
MLQHFPGHGQTAKPTTSYAVDVKSAYLGLREPTFAKIGETFQNFRFL